MAALQLNTGEYWEPTDEQVNKWIGLYPAIDVMQELNGMAGWIDANPTRRKTSRGIARFCNAWLARAQDKGGSGMVKAKGDSMKTREMTTLDDLTHDFMNDESYRARCLEKYGQYFSHDGKRVTA